LIKADANNWEAGGAEGQAIFKRGKYWYMLYSGNACCGENCNYQVGMARAEKLQGPWTKFSGNPVLVGDEAWKCPGHGTVVITPDNRYFYLHHAYNGADFTYAGRQGVLSELIWDETSQWPTFRYGKTTPAQAEAPQAASAKANEDLQISFDKKATDISWVYDVSFPRPSYKIQNGLLEIENKNLAATGNFLGLVVKHGNYTFSTEVIPKDDIAQNITVYGDAGNAIGFGIRKDKLTLWQIKDSVYKEVSSQEISGKYEMVTLNLQSRFGRFYEFSWNIKGEKADQPPLKIEGSWLPRWDRAPRVGINVSGNEGGHSEIKSVLMKYN
jgi:beta-xylosidase